MKKFFAMPLLAVSVFRPEPRRSSADAGRAQGPPAGRAPGGERRQCRDRGRGSSTPFAPDTIELQTQRSRRPGDGSALRTYPLKRRSNRHPARYGVLRARDAGQGGEATAERGNDDHRL